MPWRIVARRMRRSDPGRSATIVSAAMVNRIARKSADGIFFDSVLDCRIARAPDQRGPKQPRRRPAALAVNRWTEADLVVARGGGTRHRQTTCNVMVVPRGSWVPPSGF